jgi:hypothetical protein
MAVCFQRMNNLQALFYVMSALFSKSVTSLKKSFKMIDAQHKTSFESLKKYTQEITEQGSSNYKNLKYLHFYRGIRPDRPVIPCMKQQIDKIEFIHDTMHSVSYRLIEETNKKITLVNWRKLYSLFPHILFVEQYQILNRKIGHYPYLIIPRLQMFLYHSIRNDIIEEGRLAYMAQKKEFVMKEE